MTTFTTERYTTDNGNTRPGHASAGEAAATAKAAAIKAAQDYETALTAEIADLRNQITARQAELKAAQRETKRLAGKGEG